MGYKNVEHANYVNRKFYGQSAAEFKKTLDDLGLNMPSGHTVSGPKNIGTRANKISPERLEIHRRRRRRDGPTIRDQPVARCQHAQDHG